MKTTKKTEVGPVKPAKMNTNISSSIVVEISISYEVGVSEFQMRVTVS